MSQKSANDSMPNTVSVSEIDTNGTDGHFVILKGPSSGTVSSLPPVVIDFDCLDQALHPNGNIGNGYHHQPRSQSESRSTTPGYDRREPIEIAFLSQLERLKITRKTIETFTNCCQTLEFLDPESNTTVMKSEKLYGFYHQNFEIFHIASKELVILVEIVEGTWSCMVPDTLQVYAPPGKSLGFIDHYSSCCGCNSYFKIRDAQGDSIYTIDQKLKCFGPTEYPIVSNTEENKIKVAELVVGGCLCGFELNINFIENIPPSRKALVIGFALLVEIIESHRHQLIPPSS